MTQQPTKTVTSSVDDRASKRFIDALRGGTDLETASAFAGLSYAQVVEVLACGQMEAERVNAGLEPNPDFAHQLRLWREVYLARAEAVVRAVAQIQKAANQGDWKAAAWWLERSVPDAYNTKTRDRTATQIFEYQCEQGHVVSMTRKFDETEATPVCGLCFTPMLRDEPTV